MGDAAAPQCLDVQAWRNITKDEHLEYLERLSGKLPRRGGAGDVIAVRTHISTLDMYCYLRARFGVPNGLQSFMRKDDSDNIYHWDFNLKVGEDDLYIVGTSREVHLWVYEPMTDEDWKALILAIKADFGRVGRAKSAILAKLEKWAVFPNKYVSIAGLCADHHATITDILSAGDPFKFDAVAALRANAPAEGEKPEERSFQVADPELFGACLQLALLTPIMAEAFINMIILMYCRPEIRSDKRQYDAFIRDHVDRKIFDLFYKCEGFARPVDMAGDVYKAFKRVVDKRNHAIHGNVDPVAERIDTVYFDRRRPLYPEGGDHVGQFHASLAKQYRPEEAVADYEATHLMLVEIAAALKPELSEFFWTVMSDPYPGFDARRNKCGHLFPERIVSGHLQGQRYDDDLEVGW